jgi:hypothetical protein
VGVKNADPTVQVVMGGLAGPSIDYVRGMIDWCREFRGTKADGSVNLCWDVINYHLYPNDANSTQNGTSTRGMAPEVSSAAQVAQSFMRLAHQYAGDMPVWVTESGYDTNQGSPLKAIAVGNKSVLQTQADWILRTALLYARWGIERTFFYQLTDADVANPVQFSSSGLINANLSPKPAADFLRQTAAVLGNFAYKATLSSNPIVDRYEANGRTAYALVVPDEQGRTAAYTLSLTGVDSAYIYHPQIGQTAMSLTRVRVQNGQLPLTVTETPTFVVAGNSAATSGCTGTGSIGWEQWTGISGNNISSIPTSTAPAATAVLTQLEAGPNLGDDFGARIRGYLCPPQDGSYVLRIAGDDDCQLWLSPDDNPAHKVQVAGFTGWTNFREWTRFAGQQSAAVSLLAGHRYYVEVLHKDGGGADHVSVGWTLPNGQTEAPIPGTRLIPFALTAACTATPLAAVSSAVGQDLVLSVYPNPFTSQTTINFRMPTAGKVTLLVYDLRGQLVKQLFSGRAEAGVSQQFTLAGAGLATGLYMVQLTTFTKVVTQKLARVE